MTIRELAERYWRAEETRDLPAILAFFTEDAVWEGPSGRAVGHAEIARFYAASAERFPGLAVRIGESHGDDDEAAIAWTAEFTDRDGRVLPLSGINIMRRRGDLLERLTTFNDPSKLDLGPSGGRRVLVTGAATGIGAAIARRFLDDGATVVGADIDGAALEGFAAAVASDRFVPVVGDVSTDDGVDAVVAAAVGGTGRLDVLVNNAAVFQLAGVGATRSQWERTAQVNLIAPALLVARATDALAAARGAVVNIASVSGHVAQADRWTYNAAKGGILSLTRCQALDLAPRGIRVNSVSPGYIWTDVLDRSAGGDRARWDPLWGAFSMLGRCGEPAEVAAAVAFLAGPDAAYVTGADLLVDGGLASMSPDGKSSFEFD